MGQFYAKAAALWVVMSLVLVIAARVLGSTQPPNPALRGFTEGCDDIPQPCWYGIVPDVTTDYTAERRLQAEGMELIYRAEFYVMYRDPLNDCSVTLNLQITGGTFLVENVSIYKCTSVRLGDLMVLWGDYERQLSGITLNEGSVQEMTILDGGALDWHTNPFETPTVFTVAPLQKSPKSSRFGWHGFVLKWRYCRLEPQYPDCRIT